MSGILQPHFAISKARGSGSASECPRLSSAGRFSGAKENVRKTVILGWAIAFALAIIGATSAHAISSAALYVCNMNDNSVSVISLDTLTVASTITVGQNPGAVVVKPDGTRAYVCNYGSRSISVIDTATDTVVTTIPGGNQPFRAALSRDGRRLYVSNFGANTVSVIDTASDAVLNSVRPETDVFGSGAGR